MKLSKDTRLVLDTINRIDPDLQGRFYTVNSLFANIKSKRIASYDRLFGILCSAEKDGLIEFADKERTVIRQLESCRSWREIRRAEVLSSAFNGVIVPIIVSVITTAVTTWLFSL